MPIDFVVITKGNGMNSDARIVAQSYDEDDDDKDSELSNWQLAGFGLLIVYILFIARPFMAVRNAIWR